jgi:uncharacterized protein with HEPN domain
MYDRELVKVILSQTLQSIGTIMGRFEHITNAAYFTSSPQGMEKLDAICMQLIAIGESLKNLDKITEGSLLSRYPHIDWRGAKGLRDIICHQYFDLDAEAIYDVCLNKLTPLSETLEQMLREFK